MKVVLFCGGQGLRLREASESLPKPMVSIGYRPILWHLMRYYAHFGYNDFVLCLGYRADVIKDYFLRYSETATNDFVLDGGEVTLLGRDIADWKITFVDTGLRASIGERLWAVREHLRDEEIFLANYGDVLTDAPLDDLVARFASSGRTAGFLAVRPTAYTFHLVHTADGGVVTGIEDVGSSETRINGGFMMFRRDVLDLLAPGRELMTDVLNMLIPEQRVVAYPYDGFWAPMDTIRDRQRLEELVERGEAPWTVWQRVDPRRG